MYMNTFVDSTREDACLLYPIELTYVGGKYITGTFRARQGKRIGRSSC